MFRVILTLLSRHRIPEETLPSPYKVDSHHCRVKAMSSSYSPKSSSVKKLVDYFNDNPEFYGAFKSSFYAAYATGLEDFSTFNIHDVDGYLRFMDEFVNWIPTENVKGDNVYTHLCVFYFIIDQNPVREYQSPIDPSSRSPWRWLSEWLIDYAKEMGMWMDTPESITAASIQSFKDSPNYRMDDYPEPDGGWKTFNEFFARHIKPDLRPIASPDDATVIVNPADCTFDGTWVVNDPGADVTTFDVKGVPWTISQLLEDMSDDGHYGNAFAGGVFTHSFLGPTDYHRQHAPVDGTVIEAKVIPGLCYLEVILKDAGDSKPRLGMHRGICQKDTDKTIIPLNPSNSVVDAPDTPGYQFIQARALILIDNPTLGLVAVLPIGMAQVSSVVLSVTQGDVVAKGQEISCFQLGGSDIVMVFQKGANVEFHQNKDEHYNFGTHVATAHPRQ